MNESLWNDCFGIDWFHGQFGEKFDVSQQMYSLADTEFWEV